MAAGVSNTATMSCGCAAAARKRSQSANEPDTLSPGRRRPAAAPALLSTFCASISSTSEAPPCAAARQCRGTERRAEQRRGGAKAGLPAQTALGCDEAPGICTVCSKLHAMMGGPADRARRSGGGAVAAAGAAVHEALNRALGCTCASDHSATKRTLARLGHARSGCKFGLSAPPSAPVGSRRARFPCCVGC